MRMLVRWQAATAEPSTDVGVMDLVLLLVASGLTLLVAAVALRAAARSNERPPSGPPEGFTYARSAGWVQTVAVIVFGVAALVLLWFVVYTVVTMG